MSKRLSPDNQHYYPAFPYPYYQNIEIGDLLDLKAFLNTLPPSSNEVADHSLPFPYSLRREVGLWKLRYLSRSKSNRSAEANPQIERGRYLVRGAGYCGGRHSPRDKFGGEINERLLAGAESLEVGDGTNESNAGRVPNITPHADGIGDWSESDLSYALESGLDPDFDSFGGSMVEVQENMARLPAEDRAAIAAYLKSIPAIESETQ